MVRYNNDKVHCFSLDVVTCLRCRDHGIFLLLTVSLHQVITSTDRQLITAPFISRRSLFLHCSIATVTSWSLDGPLLCHSPVAVFYDCGHPGFRISIPLSLLLLLGQSLFWIASLTLCVYQWRFWSINPPLWYQCCQAITRRRHLIKTSSKQLKHSDLHVHLKRLKRDTNDNTLLYN